jgi:hypothetical protein
VITYTKKILLLAYFFYACPHIAINAMVIENANADLKKIKNNIKKLNPNDKALLQRWNDLQLSDPVKNLTLEHVEDFINTYLVDSDTTSKETYNDARAMYNACEKGALHTEPTLSRTHNVFYRKKIAIQTFKNLFLHKQLKEATAKIEYQKKDIETLATGVYCSTGFALLFAGLLIWKSFK